MDPEELSSDDDQCVHIRLSSWPQDLVQPTSNGTPVSALHSLSLHQDTGDETPVQDLGACVFVMFVCDVCDRRERREVKGGQDRSRERSRER